MRLGIFVVASAVVACNLIEPGPPDGVTPDRFDRTLASVKCWTEMGLNNAPCVTYGAASHMDYVDSGRVAFSANGTVQWMLGTHKYQCPCYLGGCTTPCSHGPPTVSTQSGTYTVAADSIVLQFTQGTPTTRVLKGKAPPINSPGYTGPDSLVCVGCGVFYAVVFKSN